MNKRDFVKLFPSCFAAHVFLFFGILTTNRLYIDDIGRSMRGYSDWTELGARPLADLFITAINLGTPLVNTFPLPQLLSICIAVIAGIILAKAFAIQSRLMVALCTLPLAGQPYYLENMSYTFDSPFMTLSLLLCVVSAIQLFSDHKYKLLYSIAMLFAALNLYQAGFGVFFVICLFLTIKNMESAANPPKYLTACFVKILCASAVSSLLYLSVIKIFKVSAYVSQHGEIVGLNDGYPILLANTVHYFQILWNDWSTNGIGYIFILLFFLTVIIALIRTAKLRHGKRILSPNALVYPCITLIVLVSTWAASYFPQLLLETPQWAPRTFNGIGAILSCCCLYSYSSLQHSRIKIKSIHIKHFVTTPICILVFALNSFAYAFAKANIAQMYYEDAIVTRIADDIETLDYSQDIQYLSYIGRIESNPLLLNTQKKYPLIGKLVPIHLVNNWIWGYRQLTYEGIRHLKWKKITDDDKVFILDTLAPSITNTNYSIYLYNNQLIIQFHEK